MKGPLEVLKEHREDILLAEVAALLHDVGKFCDLHIETGSTDGSREWCNAHAYKAVVDDPRAVLRLSRAAANLRKPDAVNDVLNAASPKIADFLADSFKDALKLGEVSILGDDYTLAELIMLGTPGFATHQHRLELLEGKDGWLPSALGVCHHEAHHDKQDPAKGEGLQESRQMFFSTAFGYEEHTVVIGDAERGLDARLKRLPVTLAGLTDIPGLVKEVAEEFSHGLADTQRPINEITLADWASTVMALFKSALSGAILTSQKPGIRGWFNWRDKVMDHDLRWRLLRINFDVLGLYARAVKIADLLAYQEAVRQSCEGVKSLVELEYPLGNEVYRDTTGIYFTFPDIELPPQLAGEIRDRVEEIEWELAPRIEAEQGTGKTGKEQLKVLLADQRRTARKELAWPVTSQTLKADFEMLWEDLRDGRWEPCPVCRLRPMREGAEACEHCETRRESRVETWLRKPRRTIWMDEIADHNGRVALMVGKLGLDDWLSGDLVQTLLVRATENSPKQWGSKNPSPARLRRIWRETEGFWGRVVDEILAEHHYAEKVRTGPLRRVRLIVVPEERKGWVENTPYDGTIGGRPVSLFWLGKEQDLTTISNLQLAAAAATNDVGLVEEWHGATCRVSRPDRPHDQIEFAVQRVEIPTDEKREYDPYLTLLMSPDEFLALVPASDALDLAAEIRKLYGEEFGKVQNRLPLFLGLVFFQRKMPLGTAVDMAQRMLKQVSLGDEIWRVEGVSGDQVTFANGLQWTVPTTMGDGATEDPWYPYFSFEGHPGPRRYCFEDTGDWLVHVSCLKKGDRVRVMPSRFAYVYLEHTAQRFTFDPGREVMLLDELPRLMDMWEQIQAAPDMTDTKLRGIQALFDSRWQAWRLDENTGGDAGHRETFRQLVNTTFARLAPDEKIPVTPEDVLNKRFQRCLELHLRILKKRVKEETR